MNVLRVSRAGERQGIAAALLAICLLSLLLGFRPGMNRQDVVGYGLQVPAPGIDLSYTYAMNRASAEGRVFGRDFVSTYGPFGYVIAAMDVPGIVVPWIWSQLFLCTALGLAAFAYAASVDRRLRSILAAASLLLVTIHVLADEYRWFSLALLLVLLGLRAKGRGGLLAFATVGLLAGFGALVKLSLGVGTLLTLIAAALVAPPRRGIVPRLALSGLGAGAGLVLGLWLHAGSLAGLFDYLATAAAVTSGYSSAMSFAEPEWWKAAVAFGIFAACLAAALLGSGRRDLRAVLAALAAPTFVAWKHGVVRQDMHVQLLVLFGFVLAAIVLVEIAAGAGLRRASPWLLLAVVALVRVWFESPYTGPRPGPALGEALLEPLRLPGLHGLRTLARLRAHRAELARESAVTLESLRLPEPARSLLGSQPADVYPWEASYAAANDFHWQGRPSPASFATYTPALDRRNAAFFESASRPAFVLWHRGEGVRSIDRRHLAWDEPRTFLTLLDRYDLAWRGEVLLLQARSGPRFARPERVATVTAEWDQWLPLPRVAGALVAEIEIDTPLASRVRRFLLREEAAFVAVRFSNGERVRYRYVPDQARTGLWMQPLARNGDDMAALFAGSCPRARVEEIRFLGGFRPGAKGPRLTFWRVPGASGPVFGCGD